MLEKYALNFATAGDLLGQRKAVRPSSMLVAFGNPTEANLDGALEEVKAIRRVFPQSTVYTEDQATKARDCSPSSPQKYCTLQHTAT